MAIRLLTGMLLLSVGIAQADLIGFYQFNGSLADSSGSGNTATATGTPVYANNSPFGGETLALDGSASSIVTAPIDIRPSVVPEVTFGGWFYATALTSNRVGLISTDDGNFDRTLDIDDRQGGEQWSAFLGGTLVGGGAVTLDTWTFLAISYNQSTQTYVFDVNGTTFTGSTNFDSDSTSTVTIGENPNFNTPFEGNVADVFVYNSSLGAADLQNLYTYGPSAIASVPEPATLALAGCALGVFFYRRQL